MVEKEIPGIKAEKETPVIKPEGEKPPIQAKVTLIDSLNKLLISELAAINQYTLHAGAIDYGGYKALYESIDKGAKEEMKNAQLIISRILKLGGSPAIKSISGINFGKSIDEQLLNDLFLQKTKIKEYLEIIELAKEQKDDDTTKLLQEIMIEQVKYELWIELQIELIKKKEMVNFIQEQNK